MKKPSNLFTVPHGGWKCRFEDGFEIVAQHHTDLLRQAFQHMEGNDMDTGNGWQLRVWDLVCKSNPELPCDDVGEPPRTLGTADVRRFLKTMWETLKSGAQSVSDEVQNSRINTCLGCPLKTYQSCFGG